MSSKPEPRKAFAPRRGEPGHPLDPTRAAEPSRLAEPARKPFSARLPPDLIKDVKIVAAQQDLDVQEIVEQALREWLSRLQADK
jgi:hypothetical protein